MIFFHLAVCIATSCSLLLFLQVESSMVQVMKRSETAAASTAHCKRTLLLDVS